jgi:hypothetical protein
VIRQQLSLYVPATVSTLIEAVRQLLDPVQATLIPAHVTLCREDELLEAEPMDLREKFAEAAAASVTLVFGSPEPFQEHGVLLPCVSGEPEFQALRRWALGGAHIRRQVPHITLAHPRNPRASTNNEATANLLPNGLVVTFASVSHIQQVGSQPWQVLEHYALTPSTAATPNPSIDRTAFRPSASKRLSCQTLKDKKQP